MQTHVGVADHARSLQIMESQFDVIKIEKVEQIEHFVKFKLQNLQIIMRKVTIW